MAQAFGLTDLVTANVVATNGGSFNATDGTSNAEKYGAVLAALSGVDKLNGGDMQATIDQLVAKISVTGSSATLDDTAKYAISAGAKTAAAASNAPTGLTESVAGTVQISATTTAQTGMTLIGAYAAGSSAPAPATFDYANANITGIDSAVKLQLINDLVHARAATDVDSAAKLQVFADAVSAMISCAAGAAAPTLAQFQALGISGLSADNLAVINAAIAATADNGSAVDTLAELQTLVTSRAQAMTDAIHSISLTAQVNSANDTNTFVSTYSDAGVTGVTAGNLGAMNSALNSAAVLGTSVDTVAEIQALVDAYKAILDGADGIANGNASASSAQLATIGVTGVSAATASLLGTAADALSSTAVDTFVKLQALAATASAVIASAGGATPATLAQLTALGISGATSGNLQAVQAAIAATADDGSGVDTRAELQAVVSAVVAISAISSAAQSNSASASGPAASLYTDAGVGGVNAANLAAINDALNSSAVNAASVDTTAEIQTLVTAYQTILAGADGTANGNASASAAQYASIGVTGVSSTSASLLDSVTDRLAASAVDSVAEVQALASAALAVVNTPAGGAAPNLAQLQTLGVTGVTAGNLSAVQHAMANTASNGTGVDTLAELQALATGAAGALATLSTAAQQNTASAATTPESVYAAAGVTGVTSSNVAAINGALNSSAVVGASVSGYEGLQALVDAYKAILASADGVDNVATAANPAPGQYGLIGVAGVDSATKSSLLGDVIDRLPATAVDSVPEVQALADTVAAVLNAAAGGTAPTLAQLQALGVSGASSSNLAAVQAAIAATADDGTGVDTFAELQAVVSAVVAQIAGLSSIVAYAQANGGTVPTMQTYLDAQITGVGNGSILASVNDALASANVTGTSVDSIAKLQFLVNAYNAIRASAD
ncbi:MAG: hypothetical protein HXX19_11715, partial [Rhodoferax sp.]|nr:hypothetical protein [Rhodoferax sp.]